MKSNVNYNAELGKALVQDSQGNHLCSHTQNAMPAATNANVRIGKALYLPTLKTVKKPKPFANSTKQAELALAALLQQDYSRTLPNPDLQTTGDIGFDFWLWSSAMPRPIAIPVTTTWSEVWRDSGYIENSILNFYLTDFGLTINAYALAGFGFSSLLNTLVLYKVWEVGTEEPAYWNTKFSLIRHSFESTQPVLTLFAYVKPLLYRYVLYQRDTHVVDLAYDGKTMYVYQGVTSVDESRHGLFYYQVKPNATELPAPVRYTSYPSFIGAETDWKRLWPDYATGDASAEVPGACFRRNFISTGINFVNGTMYQAHITNESALSPRDITIYKVPVTSNMPRTCSFNYTAEKYFKYKHKGINKAEHFTQYADPNFRVTWLRCLFAEPK